MSKRRYATGQMEQYDRFYLKLKNNSQVLGPQASGLGVGSVHNVLFDESGLESYKTELVGEDKEGNYKRKGIDYVAKIPAVKLELKEFAEHWEDTKAQGLNEGMEITDEEMPANLLEKRLKMEARLDIYTEEFTKIQERLDALADVEQKKDDRDVLKYGLICSGILKNSVLSEIDGQNCDFINKVLCLMDDRSPFNGMSVKDYRKLSADWLEERAKLDAQHLIVLQEKARKANEVVPRSFISVNGYSRIPKAYLPKWPEGVVNHLEMVPEEEETE